MSGMSKAVKGKHVTGRRAVGLDIGTSGVRAAEISLGKGPATLARFGQVSLPVGAVRDGEIVDVAEVASAIRHLWSATKFRTKRVVVGVSNQKVVVRQVDLPWLPAEEFRKSLIYQVQDYIPMPVDQAILDFHPLEEFVNEAGGRMLRVLLVAASADMVNNTVAAVQKAGLAPVMIDLTPFALLRGLAQMDELGLSGAPAEALIDVGASITNIVVHQGGVPRFVRILLMGGGDITEAVAERMGLPMEQAESIKQQTGMREKPAEAAADSSQLTRVIETSGAAFVEEVRGSLDYYLAQPSSVDVKRIVLSGGGGQLRGLAARLALATRLPVELGSAMSTLRIGKVGLDATRLALVAPVASVSVGLAIGVAS